MATATWIKDMLGQQGVAFDEMHHREVFTAALPDPEAKAAAAAAAPKRGAYTVRIHLDGVSKDVLVKEKVRQRIDALDQSLKLRERVQNRAVDPYTAADETVSGAS